MINFDRLLATGASDLGSAVPELLADGEAHEAVVFSVATGSAATISVMPTGDSLPQVHAASLVPGRLNIKEITFFKELFAPRPGPGPIIPSAGGL